MRCFLVQGALSTIQKICEDSPQWLEADPGHPLEVLVPRLLQFLGHNQPKLRSLALSTLNLFILARPTSTDNNDASSPAAALNQRLPIFLDVWR